MQNFKYYYQMPKELFEKNYKLTQEDIDDINDTVKRMKLEYETAKHLRLHKIYEDSRFDDPKNKWILEKLDKYYEERQNQSYKKFLN